MTVEWPTVPLGELLKPAGEPYRVEPERSYPNIGIYGFARGCFEKPPIDGNLTSASTLYRVRAGQFIYSRLFAFEGAYAVVPDGFDGAFVSNEFPCFEVRRDRALPGFLRWMFSRPTVWAVLAEGSKGMGDRRKRIHPEQILAYRVPLPPVDVQRRIVERLDAVESSVARRLRAAEAVGADLANLLHAAFHRISAGAPRARMGEIAPLVRRAILIEVDGSYPELGVRSFGKGTFQKPALAGAEVGTKRLFEIHAGDLVFSNVFAWEGAVAVAEESDHGRVGSHRFITRVADDSRATARYLHFWFLTPDGLKKLDEASPGGAGRNRTLGLEALDAIEVPVPSLDSQQWFDVLQLKVRAARDLQATAAAELDNLLPALLAESFGTRGG